MKSIYLTQRFYSVLLIFIALFCIVFLIPALILFIKILLLAFLSWCIRDLYFLLKDKDPVEITRECKPIWSMNYENTIKLYINWLTSVSYEYTIEDEVPEIFSDQFNAIHAHTDDQLKYHQYSIFPKKRSIFQFGKTHVFLKSKDKLFERRMSFDTQIDISVYPAIAQFNDLKFNYKISNRSEGGFHHVRRLGHGYEFDHIKAYIRGDDIRSINWKATGRMNSLMVNQYEDDMSQSVYHILDKSRIMNFKSNGMTLLDYAINTILIHSKVVLDKKDRVGFISYAKYIDTFILADKIGAQLRKILSALFHESSTESESNIELLMHTIRSQIRQRSLIFLYTNFESISALERTLPYLKSIQSYHQLVVIFFSNDHVIDRMEAMKRNDVKHDSYDIAVLENYSLEKQLIVNRIQRENIQALLVEPNLLGISTINKYLELKSKGIM